MSRVLTSTSLFILMIALVAAGAIVGISQISAACSQSQRRVDVRTIVSPRAPVGIVNVTATITDNRIVLQYAINNRAVRQPASVEFLAFTLDEGGRVKGGEGWTVGNATTENRPESFLRILKTEPGDRLVLTVWRSGDIFEVNETELNNLLRPRAKGMEQPVKGRPVKAALAERECCLDRLVVAKTTVSCGVKSFSCNPTSGEWSFTSYSKAESPAECVQAESESE